MTYEELLQLSNIEVFITSDHKSFVFTIETYDEDTDDISIKYYKVTKRDNGHPTIEKMNNTIELLLSGQSKNPNQDTQPLRLIKIDKIKAEDEAKRNEFIQLITTIEKAGITSQRSPQPTKPYYTPVSGPELKLLKSK